MAARELPFVADEGKQVLPLPLINIAESVLEEGLANKLRLEHTAHELAAFTEADGKIVGPPQVFQAWTSRE